MDMDVDVEPPVSKPPVLFCLQTIVNKGDELWLFGVNPQGESLRLHVSDYQPTFYLHPPFGTEHRGNWEDDLHEFRLEHQEFKNEELVYMEFVTKTPFIGFTNHRKDPLIQLTCTSIKQFTHLTKFCKDEQKWTIYHAQKDGFNHANQFLQQSGFQYQDWICVEDVTPSPILMDGKPSIRPVYGIYKLSKEQLKLNDTKIHPVPAAPRILKSFLRLQCVSQTALLNLPFKLKYTPVATEPFDRITSLGFSLAWGDSSNLQLINHFIFSWLPLDLNLDLEKKEQQEKVQYIHCADEKDILVQLTKILDQYDPDDLFEFPDQMDALAYVTHRAKLVYPEFTWERWKKCPTYQSPKNGAVYIRTRNVMNMEKMLRKKVIINLESYDLYTASCHKKLRRPPEKRPSLETRPYLTNACLAQGAAGLGVLWNAMQQDLRLLVMLEHDTAMRFEAANLSRITDTPLTTIVGGGQQVRVLNRLVRFCLQENVYVNDKTRFEKPLRFGNSAKPPTFPCPPEPRIISEFRSKCEEAHSKKLHAQDVQVREHPLPGKALGKQTVKRSTKEAEGGNVMIPCPGVFDDKIGILDFASLYPSLMMAYGVCYSNVVFKPEYLNLPGVKYRNFSINRDETVVLADTPGIIPKLLRVLVDARASVRKKAKTETDPFRRALLDVEQNSIKVICNATYGFVGARKGKLSVSEIMYVVTSIGRYLQLSSSDLLAHKYQMVAVYGDTDSIFMLIQLLATTGDIQQVCAQAAQQYDFPELTWDWVKSKYPDLPLDAWERSHQINAIVFQIMGKLTAEVTATFPKPVKLEPENLAYPLVQEPVKKHYACLLWDDANPSKLSADKPIKITGLAAKKREYCIWLREEVLLPLLEMVLYKRLDQIEPLLEKKLDDLVHQRIPLERLMISKEFKSEEKYKTWSGIHLNLAEKIKTRTGQLPRENSRIQFLVMKGKEQLQWRGECLEDFRQEKRELDIGYYLENQFYKPVRTTLQFYPEACNFPKLFKKYMEIYERKDKRIANLSSMFRVA